MGINVYIETERHEQVEALLDPTNILPRVLPAFDDRSSRFARYIDAYGETVFNELQIPGLLDELERLHRRLRRDDAGLEFIEQVIEMAKKCLREPHLYLRFSGD